MIILANPEKNFFFTVFRFFFSSKILDFGFFDKWRHPEIWMASFVKNAKITYFGWKKKSKNREKKFFFRIGQNYPKITKKVKKSKFRPILLRLEPIFGHFLRWPKSPNSFWGRICSNNGLLQGQNVQKSRKFQKNFFSLKMASEVPWTRCAHKKNV